MVNFGWEYVWHCHILSHEEMDMMRPQKLNVGRSLAETPTVNAQAGSGSNVVVTWTDGTPANMTDLQTWGNLSNEVAFRIERAVVTAGTPGTFDEIGTTLANVTTFTDTTAMPGVEYAYRVVAKNAAGERVAEYATFTVVAP